jgi:ABC-2 type transport system ATP-binding protein
MRLMGSSLECRNLTKRLVKDAVALDDVSFSVETNGIFALLGRNGAGKTTLIRILATELQPSSGSASIDGMDVMKGAGEMREQIAVMPQEARLVPWLTPRKTIYSYLLYGGFGRKEVASKVARAGEVRAPVK